MAKLQLALDFIELDRAIAVAKAAEKYVDWIEAGTPLIKSCGLDCVRKLKKEFPEKKILADMKIMDTGALEVEIAAKAGADLVTVMGAADISTIREAIESGSRFGTEVVVDLLGVSPSRIKEIAMLSPAYLCLHIGIDQQMTGGSVLSAIHNLPKGIPFCASGGLTKDTVGSAAKSGADVIVVGGAITKASDPSSAAREIRAAIDTHQSKHVKKESVTSILAKASTPNISDAMQRKGECTSFPIVLNFNPKDPKAEKIIGRALTVRTFDGDWAKPVEAIDLATNDTILVISASGCEKAIFGGLAAESAVQKKIKAVIIDGACRDIDEILSLPLPLFAKVSCPTAGEPKGLGEINSEIVCGGAKVRTGDLIVIDATGIVVIPHEREYEIANRAVDVAEKEERLRAEIRAGSTLSKVLKLARWEIPCA